MPKEDIIGGLLLAVQKGESLEQAMLSFFNAGYKREEIEDAAREVQTLPDFPIQKPQPRPKVSLKPASKLKKLPQTSQLKPIKKLKPILQNVPKAIKSSISNGPIKESSTKGPLSLSNPTPKLNESSNEPPKPHEQEQLIKEFQQPVQTIEQIPEKPFQQPLAPVPEQTLEQQIVQQKSQQLPPQPMQNRNKLASNYGGNRKNPKSVMIWILSTLLFALVLFLGGVFLFRDSLIGFFNNLL